MKSKCEFTTFRTSEFLPNKPSLYLNPIPAGVLENQYTIMFDVLL